MAKRFQLRPFDVLGQTEQPPRFAYSNKFRANPFDLLGQAELFPYPARLPGRVQPKLTIAWNSFHQNFFSGIPVLFQSGRVPKNTQPQKIFRDCFVERPMPRRAVLAAFLLYVAAILMPWPNLPAAPRRNPAFDNTELTWSGRIEDLPLLNIPKQKSSAVPKSPAPKPVTTQNTDAYHPRQRIYTDPVHPTHPRQTLVNPAAPPAAPKFLPPMPNVVQIASAAAPARPHLEISEKTLAKLRPKQVKAAASTDAPKPEVPNFEQHTAEISLTASPTGPERPKLQINPSSAPRVAEHSLPGENATAPDAALSSNSSGSAPSTLIALSNSPAPPTPVTPVPQGNLAARVAISPEGKPGGTGSSSNGEAGGGEAGNSNVGISISGGTPKPNAGVSGLGAPGNLTLPKPQSGFKRPDPNLSDEDPPERLGPPNFAALSPDSKPEQIFSSKRVYSMNVNMPNLNSVTGSWLIHFSELHLADYRHRSGNVSAPVPLRKVDPKYPQTLIEDHVEGEVILYGVIRKDGTVDSIQVVRGIDDQLDANAVSAFGQWKFEPATKEEQPVDLEAIVYIPFHAPARP